MRTFFLDRRLCFCRDREFAAQEDIQVNEPTDVIENPFAAKKPKPRVVLEEPQTSHRAPITYQNPFAAMSKSPPVDTSLRPGPVSRWQPMRDADDEDSMIKSAILSTQPGEIVHAQWDQLPPAENLQHRTPARDNETDPTFYSRLVQPPETIQFTPKPLTQPVWLTAGSEESLSGGSNRVPLDPALFETPVDTAALVQNTISSPATPSGDRMTHAASAIVTESLSKSQTKDELSQPIAAERVDTPLALLDRAQRSAARAGSPEDLSAVIELCDRGMRGRPTEKLATSLRRLAAWAHNRRGELRAEAGQTDSALDDFQAAISLDSTCSLAFHNRAVTLAQQNQFAAALRDFNRVIELNPGLAVAYCNRAELLATLGRMDEAIADYNQAVESLPDDAQLYRGRAFAYQRLGNFPKAAADLNRAITISPNDAGSLTQRGNLAAEQGNYDRAVADFRRALALDPNLTDACRSLAWLEATCPNPRFQNPQQAIAEAEQAAKCSPANDYLVLDTLAAARASAGQFHQAIEIQEQALAGAPPELRTSLERRLALYRQGRAFRSVAPSPPVRAASHETPAELPPASTLGEPLR